MDKAELDAKRSDLQKYTLYWLDGTKQVVEGDGIADAYNRAGLGASALKLLDYYGDHRQS